MPEQYRPPKFGDLTPNMIVRIPYASVNPDRVPTLPPAVKVLAVPTPCPLPGCKAVEVMTREVDGGAPHLYHRLPHQRDE
ncbi:hypothetical protein OG884_26705 [Streptosporangium sp. NBC_01755]|uniref:hypothetical protein n=1 Tax=Streptosporangium sp. NBC_01755 TaxID=2975949 RepID=UPI002DDA85D9|nr:hypothetical protein [Streptosporangium sp. NBC_01755]WSC98441.1 hypothetical protein OG884_26705 [Streptosporangium sp. NBC_01755]